MMLPTPVTVGQEAARLAELAQSLECLAPGMDNLCPGLLERCRDVAEKVHEEARHLTRLYRWMTDGPWPEELPQLSEWLRELYMAADHSPSCSHSPDAEERCATPCTGKRPRQSE